MNDFTEVEVLKFDTLIKRKDIKNPQWFAMEFDILGHPDFFNITGDEFKAYVWIIGVATKLNNQRIRVYPELFQRQTGVSKKVISLTIEKLKGKRFHVTDPLRICTESVRTRTATVQDSTVQDSTEQNSTVQGRGGIPFQQIFEHWNNSREKLPAVKKLSEKRKQAIKARWKEYPEIFSWTVAIENLVNSDFCNGDNDRAWVADFDFLLKPDTITKALEGKYSNRKKISKSSLNTANLINKITNGEL